MRRWQVVALCALALLTGCGKRQDDLAAGRAGGAPASLRAAGTSEIPRRHLESTVRRFNQGVALMERSQPSEAVEAFDEVVRLAPRWLTGRVNLGIALLNTGDGPQLARAEVEFRHVIERDDSNPFAHYALGMLLRHLTRFDEARREFERVLEIDPDDADAHYQLGVLLADDDPESAASHLRITLERVPHHEAASYRLQSLLRRGGHDEEARAVLARFESLKAAGVGISPGMKYGEMGRYAEVIRGLGPPDRATQPEAVPGFTDVASRMGLVLHAPGAAGWPGQSLPSGSEAFGPGVAVTDVDGDADLDVFMTSGRGALFLNQGGRFTIARATGIDGRNAIGAWFGDYDADGDPDLYLTCTGRNRLYRNDGSRFTDVTARSGTAGGDVLSVGAAWADADHDGDLDLYVANFARRGTGGGLHRGAPNALLRNNGNGTFTDVARLSGVDGGETASTSAMFFDVDDDRDLDLYVVNDGSASRLYLNDRVGHYTEATARFPQLANAGSGLGAVLADVDQDGSQDVLMIRAREAPRLLLQTQPGVFVEDRVFGERVSGSAAVGALVGDLDLDGDPDIVLLGADPATPAAHRVLMNLGAGRFAAPSRLGAARPGSPSPPGSPPDARGAVAADFDGDGALELLVSRAGSAAELWRAAPPPGHRWLEVVPVRTSDNGGMWPEPGAVGLSIEVKTGRVLQSASITSASGYLGSPPPRAHFGLGRFGSADYVRLEWPDATLQSELDVAGDQRWQVNKLARKPSSCPVLFSWSGERFDFVTDFLGVGGVGFFVAPGAYAPPDPTEDVRIPPELVSPRAGRYLLRVAEPLEEVTYLDQLHLNVYDHSRQSEIYPDERFVSTPPLPTGRPIEVARRIFPLSARDDRDRDVLDRLLAVDRRYVEPPADTRFAGYAQDHWVELDFGDRLRALPAGARLVLFLEGWVEYTYSHVNYAAYQAGLTMRPPAIEVTDGHGGWRTAIADAGFPAGLPRMMTVDVSGLGLGEDGRLRIRTNMEIFWDLAFAGVDEEGKRMRTHVLKPAVAELRMLGYPREYSPDGADPTLYDYQRIDHGVPFKGMTGDFTRWGDVRPLLERGDDRFVVMGRGEELALEFDATRLPALPPGWSRTLVLHTEGYCKDMDLYTAFPETVEPLPYRAMSNYPPPGAGPAAWARSRYVREWNTRRASRP